MGRQREKEIAGARLTEEGGLGAAAMCEEKEGGSKETEEASLWSVKPFCSGSGIQVNKPSYFKIVIFQLPPLMITVLRPHHLDDDHVYDVVIAV